jgi:UDP-glucose 4-epimerase
MSRVVLVTGVCQDLGRRLARSLAANPDVEQVIGVDVIPPRGDLGSVRFVRADIRNPVIAKVVVGEDVDTVVHTSVIAAPGRAGGRSTMKEINVIGTMQLLAACQRAPSLRKLVLKSSTAVYGASPRDPAMFTEDMAPKAMPRSGFAKDAVEVEGYVRGLARRRPDLTVTIIRQANVIGPTMETGIGRYFSLPVIPTVLGYDARLQLCHEQDALDSLRLAVTQDAPGAFNIAGDGVLMLSQAIRRGGRPRLLVPSFAVATVGGWFRSAKLADFSPEQTAFLTYGRGVDTRRMREVLGFEPAFTTEQAFDDYLRGAGRGRLSPDRIEQIEQGLRGLLVGEGRRG